MICLFNVVFLGVKMSSSLGVSSGSIRGLDRSFRSVFFYVFRVLDTRIPSVDLLQCRRVLLLVDVWD